MLCLSGEAGYIDEPFNPFRWPGWMLTRPPYWYVYVSPENESEYGPLMRSVVDFRYPAAHHLMHCRNPRQLGRVLRDASSSFMYRARRPRPLLKDPIALFSSEWLAETFDARVVVMIRHPAGFAGSVKRLNWQFKFKGWLAQEPLLRDWLHPFEEEMRYHSTHDTDIIDQAILVWKAIYHVVYRFKQRHPAWSFVRHEDLAEAPHRQFRDLYATLGLRWGERVEGRIAAHSSQKNPGEVPSWLHATVRRDSRAATRTWQHRLTTDEIKRISYGVADVARHFYSEDELQA
jgi:Sulfotransferase family